MAVIGMSALAYAEVVASRTLRVAAFVVVTVCVVAAAILAAFHDDEP